MRLGSMRVASVRIVSVRFVPVAIAPLRVVSMRFVPVRIGRARSRCRRARGGDRGLSTCGAARRMGMLMGRSGLSGLACHSVVSFPGFVIEPGWAATEWMGIGQWGCATMDSSEAGSVREAVSDWQPMESQQVYP